MRRLRWFRLRWFSALLLLAIGCSAEQREMLTRLKDAQAEVAKVYPGAEITINLMNEKLLIINVVNSSLNDKSEDERAAKAREAGKAALPKLEGVAFEDIRVVYIKRRGGIGITITNALGSHGFTRYELRQP